jgi:aspartate ammonia-lyase
MILWLTRKRGIHMTNIQDIPPRTESDLIGSINLPSGCLYGIQTARALSNFTVSHRPVRLEMIRAMVQVKLSAARTHKELGLLTPEKADAICAACDMLLSGILAMDASRESNFDAAAISPSSLSGKISSLPFEDLFPTDALQGGAGTSTNMNVNEVLANIGLLILGHNCGEYEYLHPLDDVNLSQSTNDVYPTSLRIASITLVRDVSQVLSELQESLQKKEKEFADIPKLGRTQLMDAIPITLGEEFGAYAQAVARDRWRIYKVEERLRQMNLGGTAVGTGANATRKYSYLVTEKLQEITGLGMARAEYPMDLTQNCDVFVEVSGLLKSCAVNLIKISGDLRLMNSGPRGGFGEIHLEERQAGSTIMPGKVNPVMAEMTGQTAMQVIANDTAITLAAMSGQFELNAFLPLIADKLLESLFILKNAVRLFRVHAIDTLVPDTAACIGHLTQSYVLSTALVPDIGYDKAAEISRAALASGRTLFETALKMSGLSEERLHELLDIPAARTYLPGKETPAL